MAEKPGGTTKRAFVPATRRFFVEFRSAGVSEYRSQGFATSYRELNVYRQAMDAAMAVLALTKTFPAEERYALTDQVRRSSRSVCANLAEAWRKRRYKQAFIAKLSDSESEAAETQVWIEFAVRCGYISKPAATELTLTYDGILAQLVAIIDGADRWIVKPRTT